jgi:hypothetical protein
MLDIKPIAPSLRPLLTGDRPGGAWGAEVVIGAILGVAADSGRGVRIYLRPAFIAGLVALDKGFRSSTVHGKRFQSLWRRFHRDARA